MYLFPNMPAHTLTACFPAMLLRPVAPKNTSVYPLSAEHRQNRAEIYPALANPSIRIMLLNFFTLRT
jgi:hypothetical protein